MNLRRAGEGLIPGKRLLRTHGFSREIPQTAFFWRRYPRFSASPRFFLVSLLCTNRVPGITSAIRKNRGKTTGIPKKAGLRNLSSCLPRRVIRRMETRFVTGIITLNLDTLGHDQSPKRQDQTGHSLHCLARIWNRFYQKVPIKRFQILSSGKQDLDNGCA